MGATSQGHLTVLLQRWEAGDLAARDRLLEVVQLDLRKIAARRLRAHGPSHTLQPTALVNELFVRFASGAKLSFQSRTHFFSLAARTMRRILVEHARKHAALKRQGGLTRVTFDEALLVAVNDELDLTTLDRALNALAADDANAAHAVELRFFGGLTINETAAALGVSPAKVKRDISYAKAWLYLRMTQGPDSTGG